MAHGMRQAQVSSEDAAWLAGSIPQIFWIAGADGKICHLSERFTEFTGLDANEVITNDRWKDVIYPDDLPSLEALWRNARAGASESRSYFRMRHRDGQYRWMHSIGRPVFSTHTGTIAQWIGGLVDVDCELRDRCAPADASHEVSVLVEDETDVVTRLHWRFRSLFHDRNIGVLEADLSAVKERIDGLRRTVVGDLQRYFDADAARLADLAGSARSIELNRALALMLGFEEADACLVGSRHLLSRLGTRSPLRLAIYALLAGLEHQEGVAELDTTHGGRLTVNYAINLSADGTCYVTLVDITQQQRAIERELAARAELAQANRAATIGALSMSIAHELNQPITSMRLELRSLQLSINAVSDIPVTIQSGVERLARQCERLTEIIQRTRDRLLTQNPHLEPIDLGKVAQEVPTLLHREIEDSQIRLEVVASETPSFVEADPAALQQVLVNLVLNAIEANRTSPVGKRWIRLSVTRLGSFIQVQISDSGKGIPERDLTRIFDPFFTTKPGGVGMGLQICRTIVESLGGDLQVHNIPGGGAQFEFSVPVRRTTSD
jgi:PAS domain S-box-containing protein